jgi:hypothetical protein
MSIALQLNHDGNIDVEALEKDISVAGAKAWIRARCEGDDELLAIDHDSLEDPHSVFVDLWRRSIAGSRVRLCIDRSCAELVEEAWSAESRPWVNELLRLIATVRPESAQQFLASIVRHAPSRKPDAALPWLEAAAAYPCLSGTLDTWKMLLKQKSFAQIAYFALSHDSEMAVRNLPLYCRSMPSEERPFLLREALREIFDRDADNARNLLLANQSSFADEGDLCPAVNRALAELDRGDVFRSNKKPIFSREAVNKSCEPVHVIEARRP